MKKKCFSRFVNENNITSFDALIRVRLNDGTVHEAVWITGLPDLSPSFDGRFNGIIGDERQVFYLFDTGEYAIWPLSSIDAMEVLQEGYLRPGPGDFLRNLQIDYAALSRPGNNASSTFHLLTHQTIHSGPVALEDHLNEERVTLFALVQCPVDTDGDETAGHEIMGGLRELLEELPVDPGTQVLTDVLHDWGRLAHDKLQESGSSRGHGSIDAGVCGILFNHGRVVAFHNGSGRIYRVNMYKAEPVQDLFAEAGQEARGNDMKYGGSGDLAVAYPPVLTVVEPGNIRQGEVFLLSSHDLMNRMDARKLTRLLTRQKLDSISGTGSDSGVALMSLTLHSDIG